ncbi:hypothetical protein LEMLEM_LOCUS15990 [Lemmus lemmus]
MPSLTVRGTPRPFPPPPRRPAQPRLSFRRSPRPTSPRTISRRLPALAPPLSPGGGLTRPRRFPFHARLPLRKRLESPSLTGSDSRAALYVEHYDERDEPLTSDPEVFSPSRAR